MDPKMTEPNDDTNETPEVAEDRDEQDVVEEVVVEEVSIDGMCGVY